MAKTPTPALQEPTPPSIVGLPCPFCDSLDNVVLKTLADLGHVDRVRRCRKCELTFKTVETVVPGQAEIK